MGCDPTEVVFTSGGSESNNHAIKGVFFANRDRGDHIITTAVEHPATINPCRFLEKLGAKVTVLPVDRFGMVDPDRRPSGDHIPDDPHHRNAREQ